MSMSGLGHRCALHDVSRGDPVLDEHAAASRYARAVATRAGVFADAARGADAAGLAGRVARSSADQGWGPGPSAPLRDAPADPGLAPAWDPSLGGRVGAR